MATAEVEAATLDQINAFQMPRPAVGSPVRWYRHGERVESHSAAATVTKVMDRSVDLTVNLGGAKFAVRHINDPRLAISKDQRDQGAWDFTEEFYKDRAWRSQIESRLEALEAEAKPESTSSLNDLWSLRKSVKELAGPGWNKLTKEQCEAFLNDNQG